MGQTRYLVLPSTNYELAWGGQWIFQFTLATADKQFQDTIKKMIRSITMPQFFLFFYYGRVLSLFNLPLRPRLYCLCMFGIELICLVYAEVETKPNTVYI